MIDFPLNQTQVHRLQKFISSLSREVNTSSKISNFFNSNAIVSDKSPDRDIVYDDENNEYILRFSMDSEQKEIPISFLLSQLKAPNDIDDFYNIYFFENYGKQLLFNLYCAISEKLFDLKPEVRDLAASRQTNFTESRRFIPNNNFCANFFEDRLEIESSLKKSMSTFENEKFRKLNFNIKSSIYQPGLSKSTNNNTFIPKKVKELSLFRREEKEGQALNYEANLEMLDDL